MQERKSRKDCWKKHKKVTKTFLVIFLCLIVPLVFPVSPVFASGAPENSGFFYKIQSGDTLSQIALRFFGDQTRYLEIAAANDISNPNLLHPGQEIFIPQFNKGWFLAEIGDATWYGEDFRGKNTARGERFDPDKFTAASNTLPLGTFVKVTNIENDESIIVWINDTGGFSVYGIKIDLSRAAFASIAPLSRGRVKVVIEVLSSNFPVWEL